MLAIVDDLYQFLYKGHRNVSGVYLRTSLREFAKLFLSESLCSVIPAEIFGCNLVSFLKHLHRFGGRLKVIIAEMENQRRVKEPYREEDVMDIKENILRAMEEERRRKEQNRSRDYDSGYDSEFDDLIVTDSTSPKARPPGSEVAESMVISVGDAGD